MSKFKQKKDQAWQYYQVWMKEITYCPILKKEVKITRKGWDHLVSGSKSRKRKISDKIYRFNLLKAAKYTIKNATVKGKEKRNNTEYTFVESTFKSGNNNQGIKVILKQDKQRNYYLYSVMKK